MRSRLALALVLAVCAGPAFAQGDAPPDSAVSLARARELAWSGREAEAVRVYDALLARRATDGTAALELGRLLTWGGDPDRAAVLLAPLAAAHADSAAVQTAYAYALHAAGRPREALRQYDRALRLAPADPTLLAESGALERWEGDWVVGRHRLHRALELGLDPEARARAESVLDGLGRATAPRVGVSVEHAVDSNGLTRTRVPSHSHVQLSPALAAGLTVTQERLSQLAPDAAGPVTDAAATNLTPFVSVGVSRSLRLRAAVGFQAVHGEGNGPSATVQAEWRRASPRYLSATARLHTEAGVDGVAALGEGIRVTVGTLEGYAEPRPGWGLGVSARGTAYSDGNQRVEVSSSTRLSVARIGPVRLALVGGAGYEDTATLYPLSSPYWTPDELLTVLGGGAASVSPVSGVTVEPELFTTFQRDPNVHSVSLGYRLRARVERGRHRAGVLAEYSGSASYSVRRVGIQYEVALW